jgi:uncharacterized protein YfaS (alpha-2-macroglobulin family)
MRPTLRGLAAVLVLLSAHSFAARVEFFSPQGEVKGVRQIAARFSDPMVPFGDPRLAEPFDIECPEKGSARWADQKSWVFDFERDLPAGVRCTFKVKSGVNALDGTAVEAAAFSFTTGGPAILEYLPFRYDQIDEEQIFILGLDASAKPASITAHAYCDAKGIAEKIPVQLITGETRVQLLEDRKDFLSRYLVALFKDGRVAAVAERDLLRGTRAERLKSADESTVPIVTLQCARHLPSGAVLRLVWGAGIESQSGVPTSQDQVLEFNVRPAFTAQFSCERVNREANCLPFLPMRLAFTAPIGRSAAEKIQLRGVDGKLYKASLPDAKQGGDLVQEVTFNGPFPEQAQFKLEIPADLRDDAGRQLVNQKRFPLTVKTDVAPPLAKFPAKFGVIEAKADGVLPVTLRNVEPEVAGKEWSAGDDVPGNVLRVGSANARDIVGWMKRVRDSERVEYERSEGDGPPSAHYAAALSIFGDADKTRAIQVPKPNGAKAFEVVGIPLKQPGFYVVELASPRLGEALLTGANRGDKGRPVYHVSTSALVTNLAVHFKQGRESSLVWVTALDSGSPQARASVSVQDCDGKEYWKGTTDERGIARINKELPDRRQLPGCFDPYDHQYMVFARSGTDTSFVLSDWNEGISRWRFNLPGPGYAGPYIASAVFDRTLLRAGETVHFKLFYRQHVRGGFRLIAPSSLPSKAVVEHLGSDQRYDVALKWDAGDIADAAFQIPKDAKTGTYRIIVEDSLGTEEKSRRHQRVAGTFRVEEFRVPLMRAVIQAPAKPLVNADSVPLDVQVSYLAGGGAAYLPVKLRSVVQPRTVTFPGYDDFTFENGAVTEGVQDDQRRAWHRGDYELVDEDEAPLDTSLASGQTRPLKSLALTLDGAGGAKAEVTGIPRQDSPQEILAEAEYSDPNGEVLTASTRVPIWPAEFVVGLKADAWALSKDKVKFQVLALDLTGKPLPGVALKVDLFERSTFSHRKRLIGGFYAYQSGAEVKRVKTVCEGKSDDKGRLFCEFASPVSGEVVVQVSARDSAGNLAAANSSVWVAGSGDWWFEASNDDRMDVLPEKKRYEPGEKAVFQVRMPFRKATALVTIEREGVMEAFVTELSGKSPTVEVPVRGNHAPNIFVSVLAVRGRVSEPQPTALVDLGKPAFRMGVADINVGWRAHELDVKVSTDKSVYQVRDKVRVNIDVKRALDGTPAPKGSEIALAAVDEGLLELAPNDSWKLLANMMQRRGIEVDTATASMQVVGKRHYGRKAREPGGGGGRHSARELFDTLLFWKARVALDDQGRASAEVPLNDSLTSFRIVAVASGDVGLFGTGQTAIRATQDLMLFSGLPPLVREQDAFRAGFTLRNASSAPVEVEMHAALQPELAGKRMDAEALKPITLSLAPGVSQDVGWDVKVPVNADTLRWEVTARAKRSDGKVSSDSLKVSQTVIAAVPVRTFQATLTQLEKPLDLTIAIPADAIPGRGGVRVSLLKSLAGQLAGVAEYMSRYPFTCFEQNVSKAVALRDQAMWRGVMATLPSHLDHDGFVKYFPLLQYGSDVLTAYVLSIASEAGWDIPDGSRERMLSALQRFVQGQVQREPEWRAADLSIRKIAALQATARWGRKVVESDLSSVAIEPNLWPTSGVIDWFDLLRRAPDLAKREERLAQTEQILRSRLNFQGTTMGFSTERTDYLWWLMISGDVNANRILLSMMEQDKWREDLPRLVRGSLGRQQRGHWNTTVANAWGVLAMEQFAAKFETEAVSGVTRGSLAKQQRQMDWSKQEQGGSFMFPWPSGPASLSLQQDGGGRPWTTIQSLAAIPLREPLSSGYRIVRSVAAVEQKAKGQWSRGDLMRVHLEIEAQSDMSWVAVNDPVPAGASILGTGLGRDSQIATGGEKKQGWVWPAFEERKFDSFRAYYRFVPKGKWVLEYTLRLNNAGEFLLPPTRVEALYSPEMFGELPNSRVSVGQ